MTRRGLFQRVFGGLLAALCFGKRRPRDVGMVAVTDAMYSSTVEYSRDACVCGSSKAYRFMEHASDGSIKVDLTCAGCGISLASYTIGGLVYYSDLHDPTKFEDM
jgi:hypothetical protein